MATRFWVGGTGTWDAADTSHWAATSGGGTGASVPSASDDVTFDSNSGTAATVTINGGGSALSVTLNKSDLTLTHTTGSTVVGAVTVTTGTLNTNGQTCSWGSLSANNSNTKVFTFGASAITLTQASGNAILIGSTGTTFTANTAVFTCSGATPTININQNTNGSSFVVTGSGICSLSNGMTCLNFTRTGTAAKTDALQLLANLTCTGTFTCNGNSVTNRVLVYSGTLGAARTITAATVSVTNSDFQDITGAGAGSWNLAAITGGSGDCLGNTGITFTTAAPQTWSGTVSGNWSTNAWTSRVPLPQDNVSIASAFSASQTITVDMPRLGANLDFTGTTGNPSVSISTTGATGNGVWHFGSMTWASGMTNAASNTWNFLGRSACTLTTNAVALTSFAVYMVGATLTLQDNLTSVNATRGLSIVNGTFDANNKNVTFGGIFSAGSLTRGLTMGTGTWTLQNTGTLIIWSMVSTGMTFSGASATINITASDSAVTKTFAGAGFTYGTVKFISTGSAALVITGNNTFASLDIECTTARTLTLPASGTQTVWVLTLFGATAQTLSVVSSTPGTATTINVKGYYQHNLESLSGDVVLNLPIMGKGYRLDPKGI